ncbi:MAG TPA: DUF5117 domain-containing protein, partial [Crinalium sp.]
MKKLTLLVLFCCGIFLATPVHAWQTVSSQWHQVAIEQPLIVDQMGDGSGAEERSPGSNPHSTDAHPLVLSAAPPPPSPPQVELQPFDDLVKKADVQQGLFSLYRNTETGTVFLEVKPEQLNRNFLMVTTLESGVGEWGLFSGVPLRDFLFQLRRVQNQVQVVVPNTNFRTEPNDPQRRSVQRSFSDSVLATLPIRSIHPTRNTLLLEINDLLLGGRDVSGLISEFPWILGSSYVPDDSQSYIDQVKVFPLNVEIEAVQGFVGGDDPWIVLESLPDPRAFNLKVRYSLSQLPDTNNGYRPRLADERLGYFVTAYQDIS